MPRRVDGKAPRPGTKDEWALAETAAGLGANLMRSHVLRLTNGGTTQAAGLNYDQLIRLFESPMHEALLRAAQQFDASKGHQFTTLAGRVVVRQLQSITTSLLQTEGIDLDSIGTFDQRNPMTTVEDAVVDLEFARWLMDYAGLNSLEKMAILMVADDYTVPEIAKELCITKSEAKHAIERARRKCKTAARTADELPEWIAQKLRIEDRSPWYSAEDMAAFKEAEVRFLRRLGGGRTNYEDRRLAELERR
jgi:DNA-directed RNA polymerase specialized sigma24 family protein